MSDEGEGEGEGSLDIIEVQTSYADVAELGQGYIERVDGERILLALGLEVPAGETLRFIVLLVDGTPAFAGAGRCTQVSDQGPHVNPGERFETLLDTLAFDERSAPVYEYIVAVRQMAYAEVGGADSEAHHHTESSDDAEVEVDAPGVETHAETHVELEAGDDRVADEASHYGDSEAVVSEDPARFGDEAQESLAPVAAVEALQASDPPPAEAESLVASTPLPPALLSETEAAAYEEESAGLRTSLPAAASPALYAASIYPPVRTVTTAAVPAPVSIPAQPRAGSVAPIPLGKGILTRPASSAHWVPTAFSPEPRSPRSTQFQSAQGPLPVPAAPPRPQLDRSQWVERAPAPH